MLNITGKKAQWFLFTKEAIVPKLQASQLNLSSVQTDGAHHSRIYKKSMEREGLAIQGATWLQTGILV
jgi:hypothetical protein